MTEGEGDEPMFLPGLLLGVVLSLGVFAITHAYRGQWHVRALRQIRACPKRLSVSQGSGREQR